MRTSVYISQVAALMVDQTLVGPANYMGVETGREALCGIGDFGVQLWGKVTHCQT